MIFYESVTEQLLAAAKELGFDLCGIIPAAAPKTFDAFERWLTAGMHAGMNHFVRNFEVRKHPDAMLPGVKSIMMLAVSYAKILNSEYHPIRQLSGIAEYARGTDYHRWIKHRLGILAEKHAELFSGERCRGTCDTAPILEKQYAADAGLGTIGKNTLLINPQFGSKIFLAAFLSTAELEPTLPAKKFDPCGDCKKCLNACPTGALTEPYMLDSRRCLSYWLIIHRGELPSEIAAKRGKRFFGCETCQKVCPHNESLPTLPKGTQNPFGLDSDELRRIVAGSPVEMLLAKSESH